MPCSNPNLPGNGLIQIASYGLILVAMFIFSSYVRHHPPKAPLSICFVNQSEAERVTNDSNPISRCSQIRQGELLPAREPGLKIKQSFDNEQLFLCRNLENGKIMRLSNLLRECSRVMAEFAETPIPGHAIPATYYRLVSE